MFENFLLTVDIRDVSSERARKLYFENFGLFILICPKNYIKYSYIYYSRLKNLTNNSYKN